MSGPSMDTIVNLAKRRGFVYQSSEIYGGLRSSWDYGPLGVELKENVKRAWWRTMVQLRDDVVGIDSSVILSPKIWRASGHVDVFTDPLVECLNCHHRFRADHLKGSCPDCGNKAFTEPKDFNLMFETHMGPVQDENSAVWLRPETAQGIFINFKQVMQTQRLKLPFGIAQQGKAFRNEITPGNFIYRTYEFEQMEMEYFVRPGTEDEAMDYWVNQRLQWYTDLGINKENLRLREHEADELSHYSKRTVDIEYLFPWGWGELEGIANRTDFDLRNHQEKSGEDLTYFDAGSEERFLPYVVEPAAGATRALLAFFIDAYSEEEAPTASGKMEKRVVLRLHPSLAPFKAAVLPLSRHEGLVPGAKAVAAMLRPHFRIDYDDAGSIGKRYRRHDEVGTPFAITYDFDSINDQSVTVRDRDSMEQQRIPIEKLLKYLNESVLAHSETL